MTTIQGNSNNTFVLPDTSTATATSGYWMSCGTTTEYETPQWKDTILVTEAMALVLGLIFLIIWGLSKIEESGRVTMLTKRDCQRLSDAHSALQDEYWRVGISRDEAKNIAKWRERAKQNDRRTRR